MTNDWKPYKLKPNNQLEVARAREIWVTYCLNNDRDNLMSLVKGSSKWFDADGVKRIHAYLKQFRNGELE